MPWWNPISQAEPRQKNESENAQVEPISAKPVFIAFPVLLVPRIFPLLGFNGPTVLLQRGTKNTGYAWISPYYGLVK